MAVHQEGRDERQMRAEDRPPLQTGKYASEYHALYIYKSCKLNEQLELELDNKKEENMEILTVGPVSLGTE